MATAPIKISPVSKDKHYEIFKNIEREVLGRLSSFEHEYFLLGMRVAFDELDSSSEPGVYPFSVEFGAMRWIDEAQPDQELTEEELLTITSNGPIALEFLDGLYADSKTKLQTAADKDLNVVVAIVWKGSPTVALSVDCLCKSGTTAKKRYCYYDRTTNAKRCYCTTSNC